MPLKKNRKYFLVCEGLSNGDVGAARGTDFSEETAGGAGFKTGDFVQEKLAGATAGRPLT